MKWFNNMKISTKITYGFIFAALIAAFTGIEVYSAMNAFAPTLKLLTIIIAELLLAVIFSAWMKKVFTGSINKIAGAADKLAVGNTDINIASSAKDETADLVNSLKKIAEKIEWYDAILDAVPFPIHVTDNHMNWTYMNKAFEKLMIDQGVVKERKQGYGKACSNAGANICNTANCGIKQLQKGNAESYFDWCGLSCKQDTSYLRNHKGENLGYVEVVTDLTSILRVGDYTKVEVDRLAANLDLLATGTLNLNLEVGDADQYTVETRNDFVKINNNLAKTKEAIGKLISDISMLADSAIAGKLEVRADAVKHEGQYRKIVEGVNHTLDMVNDKNAWYEAIIDAVPFPLHVIDNDMNWTYMNKAFENLMIDQGVVKERKEGYGKACSNAGANICNTANCGIKQLQKGNAESYFDWCGLNCKQDTSYLRNHKGENIGYVEVVSDLTSILRVSDYTKIEVDRLAANLDLFAKGNLDLNLEVKDADQYTTEARDNFVKINNNLGKAKDAVGKLISDALSLSDAAVEGNLSARVDASKHEGEYAEIVKGINNTLDAVITPLDEAKHVLGKISVNDYELTMKGQYKGMLKEFADSINEVHTRLLSLQDVFVRVSKGDTSRLEEFERIGKRSESDKIVPSAIAMMQAIQDLINESNMLAEAAVNGDLNVRGHEGKFEGGYKSIIEGINKTLDAVVQPIRECLEVLKEMADGNLTVNMNGEYKGDYAKIKESLNFAIKSFNDVLNDINNASVQVASGARQVSDSSQALSQGSTEQASSIEELTASLEEISSQTKQNAANANQANDMALTAKADAVNGNERMKEMLNAMNDINEASSNISKIIKVIDEIAFQTNILALNAAVEAARAGQHGKGFAVVAEEVRNLAARSANAAKETTALIEGSIRKADDGTKIASETAGALSKIVDAVSKAADLVGEIATASNEQATGIGQINQGIMQVSQVVQTNSATSEESAAASEELSGQADMLNSMVSKFKLKKGGSTINRLEELNPDVLKMLEDMGSNKKSSTEHHGAEAELTPSRMKIALSDKEFGKY